MEGALKRGPKALGYDTHLWTLRRVADLIEQRFAVSIHDEPCLVAMGATGLPSGKGTRIVFIDESGLSEYVWGYWKQHELPNFCARTFDQLFK